MRASRSRRRGLPAGEQLVKAQGGIRPRSAPGTHPSNTPRTSGAPRTRPPTATSSRSSPARRRRDPLARGWGSRSPEKGTLEFGVIVWRAAARLAEAPPQVGDRTGRTDHEGAARGVGGWLRAPRSRTRRSRASSRWTAVGAPSAATHDRRHERDPGGRRTLLREARRARSSPRTTRTRPARSRAWRSTSAPRRVTSTRSVPPERRRVARANMGLLDPRDDAPTGAVLLNANGEGVHRFARPARRRQPGDRRRGRTGGGGVETPTGRPAVYLDTTRILGGRREASRSRTCCAGSARPGVDHSRSPVLTYPSSTTRTEAS